MSGVNCLGTDQASVSDRKKGTKLLSSEERLNIRQEQSKPILDGLHEWLILQRQNVPDGSGTAKAIDYSLKRWGALTRYREDGAVPIDNNRVENQIRPWAVGRNNWLFAGSLRSGQRAANVMSLIQSAKLNGHDPYAYLKDGLAGCRLRKIIGWMSFYRITGVGRSTCDDRTLTKKKTCVCSVGNEMWLHSEYKHGKGKIKLAFEGKLTDCRNCELKRRCMRNPESADIREGHGRQVSKTFTVGQTPLTWMQCRVDSKLGKQIYAHRMSVVEPVFGNIGTNKRLKKFSLRGKNKVQGQWQLFCMVHNIEKIMNYGDLAA